MEILLFDRAVVNTDSRTLDATPFSVVIVDNKGKSRDVVMYRDLDSRTLDAVRKALTITESAFASSSDILALLQILLPECDLNRVNDEILKARQKQRDDQTISQMSALLDDPKFASLIENINDGKIDKIDPKLADNLFNSWGKISKGCDTK